VFACAATDAKPQSKFLNHREDSSAATAVTNHATPAKIFNKFFTIGGGERGFFERLNLLWQ
jgi:hypothetical protein